MVLGVAGRWNSELRIVNGENDEEGGGASGYRGVRWRDLRGNGVGRLSGGWRWVGIWREAVRVMEARAWSMRRRVSRRGR